MIVACFDPNEECCFCNGSEKMTDETQRILNANRDTRKVILPLYVPDGFQLPNKKRKAF